MSSPVEQIKQRLGVVDVIQSYIKLDKAGANFKARCPFHSEKTASFFVSPPREIWHCFGCGKGGDIFGFVMEIEGVEFIEALKILADRAGIKLKTEDPRLRNERTRLLDLMKKSVDFYRRKFMEYPPALSYLRQRGLKDSTIQSYLLGYAPPETDGWRNLCEHLFDGGYSGEEIEKSGMAIKSEKNLAGRQGHYDRFRGRIMFPIFDFSGRIVAFSGRLFPETEKENAGGKYINSPQTILYDKSRILYGLDRAKTEVRKKDGCVLVEGQMDVLMSHQAGVLNCVAVSGIGLTPYHLETVGRLTNNLVVCFDSDEAGLIAAGRGIDLALEKGFEVKVVSLPFGKDPAEVAAKDPLAWQKAAEGAVHIIDFYLKTLSEKTPEGREFKQKVEKIILPYVGLIESEIEKTHWVKEIAKKLNIREEPIWEQLKKTKTKKTKSGEVFELSREKKTHREVLEEKLLGLAFWQKNDSILPEKRKSLEKNQCEKLALEAELYYEGMDKEALEKEMEIMENDLEREEVKEELEKVMAKIREAEASKDDKNLNKELDKFNELSKKFNQLSHEIKKEEKN